MIYYYECLEIPKFHSMFTVIRNNRWSIANKEHKFFYIEHGSCKLLINNKEFILNEGDMFYIPMDVPYVRTALNDEPCEIFSICFDISATKKETLNSKSINLFMLNHDFCELPSFDEKLYFLFPEKLESKLKTNKLKKQIANIKSSIDVNQPFNQQSSSFILCSLLTTISTICYSSILKIPDATITNEYPKPLSKSIEYIKRNYNKNITLDELCSVSFISKQMLIKYFLKYTGKSPHTYITDYKINLIKSLLISSGNATIKEICTMFGFEDQCYFSRVFKKYTGMSPKEFKIYVYEKKDYRNGG